MKSFWLSLSFLAATFAFAGCGDDDDGDRTPSTGGTTSSGGSSSSSGGSISTTGGTTGEGGASPGGSPGEGGSGGQAEAMTFFVTSDTSKTGDLGGLLGADAR